MLEMGWFARNPRRSISSSVTSVQSVVHCFRRSKRMRFSMSQFLRPNIRSMAGYTPGEQPRGDGIIKLNTNENPYPPSPRALEAMAELLRSDRLRKYPD